MNALGNPLLALLLALSLAGCVQGPRDAELPLSEGPFEAPAPAGVAVIEQRGGRLVLPPQTAGANEDIAISARADCQWVLLAGALRAALAGRGRDILFFVRDGNGNRRAMRLRTISRFTEPVFDSPTVEHIKDEHVLEILPQPGGVLALRHLGRPVQQSDVAALIESVFQRSGVLYFPPVDQPDRQEFPIWIRAGAGVTWQELVLAISLVQRAGFPAVLLELP
jgi:hypothetical protein